MPETSLDIVWRNMEKELEDLCIRGGGDEGEAAAGAMGYALLDLGTGRRAGFRQDVVSPTASTIKIAILLAVASNVRAGQLSWEQRVKIPEGDKVGGSGILSHFRHSADLSLWDLCALMIGLSDNDATNACIGLAGMDYVNSLLRDLGLTETRLRRRMMDSEAARRGDENVSTPRELVSLLEKVYRRDGIPEETASDVLSLLELPKQGPFTLGLPGTVRRANKPGGLGHVAVDAGIIYLPGHDFCLAVMGSFMGAEPEKAASAVVAAAYRYMAVRAECTELGRST
jgi:beta-lactamase class A